MTVDAAGLVPDPPEGPPPCVPCSSVVPLPRDLEEQRALGEAFELLHHVGHEHLAPLTGVRVEGDALVLEHLLPSGWRSLEQILAEVPALSPGQVVTLGVPIAQALGVVHAAGVGLGRLDYPDVVVDPLGRPELVVHLARPLPRHGESSDVASLARLLAGLLAAGSASSGLVMLLVRAGDDEDDAAGSAERFAAALLGCEPARPLPRISSIDGPAPVVTPAEAVPMAERREDIVRRMRSEAAVAPSGTSRGSRTRVRRVAGRALRLGRPRVPVMRRPRWRVGALPRIPPAVAMLVALGAVALGGVTWAATTRVTPGALAAPLASPASAAPSSAPPSSDTTDWAHVIGDLDEVRLQSISTGNLALLSRVDLPGSSAARDDARLVTAVLASGLRPLGLAYRVVSAVEISRDGPTATVRVVDRRPAYDLADTRGVVVAHRAARGDQTWRVTFARETTGEWRVQEVATAGTGPR
jgi:hypothetical protein